MLISGQIVFTFCIYFMLRNIPERAIGKTEKNLLQVIHQKCANMKNRQEKKSKKKSKKKETSDTVLDNKAM